MDSPSVYHSKHLLRTLWMPAADLGQRWPQVPVMALFGPRAIRGAGPGYPDERTSYLSNAAGLHRPMVLSRAKLTRRANHFGFSEVMSSPGIKNISLSPTGKSRAHQLPSCSAKRGVGHRHERGTGSGGRGCAFDERRGCVRRRRVVLTPRCWRQVGGKSRR